MEQIGNTTPEQMAELMAELRGEPETWERLKPGLVKMRQYLEEAWDCQEEASLVEELSHLCDLGKRLLDRLTNEEDYRRSDERSFLRRLQGSCADYSVAELAAVVTFLCGINEAEPARRRLPKDWIQHALVPHLAGKSIYEPGRAE